VNTEKKGKHFTYFHVAKCVAYPATAFHLPQPNSTIFNAKVYSEGGGGGTRRENITNKTWNEFNKEMQLTEKYRMPHAKFIGGEKPKTGDRAVFPFTDNLLKSVTAYAYITLCLPPCPYVQRAVIAQSV
jgi:hypothetical protein